MSTSPCFFWHKHQLRLLVLWPSLVGLLHMSFRCRYDCVRLPVFFAKMRTLEVVLIVNYNMDLQCWCEVRSRLSSEEHSAHTFE